MSVIELAKQRVKEAQHSFPDPATGKCWVICDHCEEDWNEHTPDSCDLALLAALLKETTNG